MSEQIQIGKASYGKQSFGQGWFTITENADNVYRILPPMKSLAREGKYAKYYRTHRGFRGTDNKQKPFRCIEVFDYKSKLIKEHCPVCDMVAVLEEEVKKMKERGATAEYLKEFRDKNIFPFQAEGKYYVNAVNQEGKIGILPLNSKLFQALDALATQHEKAGRDITGMEGVFLNFKKLSKFKGDKDAVFSVEMYLQPTNDGAFRYVTHTITPEFAERLVKEAADLGDMFRVLTAEQINQIVSLTGEYRAKYVDSLFLAPEKESSNQGMTSVIPNSNIAAVSRVEASPNGGFTVQQPTVPQNFNQQVAPQNFGQFPQNNMMPAQQMPIQQGFVPPVQPAYIPQQQAPVQQGFVPQQQAPVQQGFVPQQQAPVQQGFVPPTQPVQQGFTQQSMHPYNGPAQMTSAMNDEEFLAMCQPNKQGK